MNISISDDTCWMCGEKKSMTVHHGIPQHLRPKQNILIPVCRECHDKIHFDDVNGMYSYIHKIEKQMKENGRNLSVLKNMLDENTKINKLKNKGKIQL